MSGLVVVVGSLNVDLVLRVGGHPAPGETVLATARERYAGGKGANQAVAAARAGARTAMVGLVGDDEEARLLVDTLAQAGVDTDGVQVRVGESTGMAVVVVDGAGENAITVAPGANLAWEPGFATDRLPELSRQDVVVAQAEIPLAAVTEAALATRAAGARFVLNLAPPIEAGLDLLHLVDLLIVNEHEAGRLAATLGASGGNAEALAAVTGGAVVVTYGAAGAALAQASTLERVPALHAGPVLDTTGAGDAFVGALAAALAAGHELREAARWGTAAGAIAVTRRGAQGAPATPERLRELLAGA